MNKNIFLMLLLFSFSMNAQIPANYYNSANGMTGYALKTELSDIISNGHINRGYSNLYNGYMTTDTDNYYENDGTVLDMYSENPNGADPYNYTHNNNKCGNYSNEGDCYNREHLMPQSWFGSSSPMKSDIHHVVPSDGKVNGQRGHYPLAEVSSANWTSQNGSKRGSCANTGYSGTVFEPIDEFKGDIARIYFYMATRYEDNIGSWENANSDGSDPVLNGSSNQVFEDWYLDVLLQWHYNDPVTQREVDRNNAAYDYQGNANPFINHPEWVALIWDPTPDTQNPTAPTNLMASNVTFNSVDLTWTAATDNVMVIGYDIYRDGTLVDSALGSETSYTNYGLTSSTSYNFYVVARDGASNNSPNSNTVSITTLDGPMFSEYFDNCETTTSNFTSISEASNKNWNCITQYGENNTGAMQMNGYHEDVASLDWLISTNPIDFSQFTNETLSCYLVHAYGTMSLELVYSTDYDGNGNPSNFTWTAMPNITIDTHDGTPVETTQIISNVDISTLTQPAYVGFKYTSNGSPTRWTIDSFVIQGNPVSSINDIAFSNRIVLYPNPVKEVFFIKSDTKIKTVAIYNYVGELILVQKNNTQINTSKLNQGVYLCKITNEFGKTAVLKLVKK